MATVLIPIPDRDFDPTEVAVSWQVLTGHGHDVVFATESGRSAVADDIMVSGRGLDICHVDGHTTPQTGFRFRSSAAALRPVKNRKNTGIIQTGVLKRGVRRTTPLRLVARVSFVPRLEAADGQMLIRRGVADSGIRNRNAQVI